MLQMSLGRSIRPSRDICTTTAAIWLEGKVFDALCAAAIQTSNYANTQQASQNSTMSATASKLASGDTTATTQGAGSAFNRYLANVTRLTFALQVSTTALQNLLIKEMITITDSIHSIDILSRWTS
jgi:hypothetical protein